MEKIIVLMAIVILSVSCKKKQSPQEEAQVAATPPPTEAYCIYQGSAPNKVLLNCVSTNSEAIDQCLKYRDEGKVNVTSVKKSKCDDC